MFHDAFSGVECQDLKHLPSCENISVELLLVNKAFKKSAYLDMYTFPKPGHKKNAQNLFEL